MKVKKKKLEISNQKFLFLFSVIIQIDYTQSIHLSSPYISPTPTAWAPKSINSDGVTAIEPTLGNRIFS